MELYVSTHRLFWILTAGDTDNLLFWILLGGRTAWSSKVLVQGHEIAARYFYDGDHVNNAREDAAERALIFLSPKAHQAIATTKYEGQLYPYEH